MLIFHSKIGTLHLFLFLFPLAVFCQIPVNDTMQLNQQLNNLAPGDVIILEDGTWTDIQMNIEVAGTLAEPVIIRAQTKNGVTFQGDSWIRMGGSYITIQGFTFMGNEPTKERIIELESEDSLACSNCKVLNITFDAYQSVDALATIKWIVLRGQHNEIAHCSFLNKSTIGSCVLVPRKTNDPDYHFIHHNIFARRHQVWKDGKLQNDLDAIRIGNSGTAESNSYSVVANNFFYDWDGEVEIISNKSSMNHYYNNTFYNYFGTLTLRHGNNCEVYNNFFLANNHFKSGGI